MLNRNFWLLLVNRTFTRIAYHITTFALIVWVFRLTGVNIAVSLWMVIFFAASFFTSFIAGVVADLYDRRLVMILANLGWAVAALAFLLVENSFAGILFVSFFAQSLDEFFSPTQGAVLPQVVPDRALTAANAILSLATYAAVFLGYFLSGIMLRFIGYPAPFVTAAILVILGAIAAAFLPDLSPDGERVPLKELFTRTKERLIDQLRFLIKNPKVSSTLMLTAVIVSASTAAGSLAPGFAEQALRIDARDLSFVGVLPIGLGLVLGAWFLSWKGQFIQVWQGIAGLGLALLALAASPVLRVFLANHGAIPQTFERIPFFSLWIAFLMFFLGLFASAVSIPIVTSLQRITPGKNMGRTFAALGTIVSVLTTIIVLIFGPVADLLNPAFPVAFVGLAAFGAAFWVRAKVVIK